MRLRQLGTSGFRNLAPGLLDVDAPLVAWWGDNGQGKTNFLEAVAVLGALRSFRAGKVAEVVRAGERHAEVRAVGESEGLVRRFEWAWADGERRLRREDRPVDAASWLGSLRATWFAPEDVLLVRGEPALRRALLDRAVLNLHPAYLGPARDFRRVLDQRAALLREGRGSEAEFDVLDEQLGRLGAKVSRFRAEAVASVSASFGRHYAEIAGAEVASVRLRSWLGEGDEHTLAARYVERLAAGRAEERSSRRVAAGPHRDDLDLRVGGAPARTMASQGQARSLVLAWKVAELEAARDASGEAPLFLMDDLGSELDPKRTAALMELLRSLGAQVFVSTTDLRFLPRASAEARLYRVEAGAVTG